MDRQLEKVDRNYEVVRMFKEGYRVPVIAKKFDITKCRVYQLVNSAKKKEEKKNGRK